MKRMHFLLIIIVLGIIACTKEDGRLHFLTWGSMPLPDGSHRNEPARNLPEASRKDTTVYITAVVFPDDYDWRRDTAMGDVQARLILLKNGSEYLSMNVGKGQHISTAPDMHIVVEGGIVSEWSSQTQTILCYNGKQFLKVERREMLRGVVMNEGSLWTLSQGRDGRGVFFRKDGIDIFSRPTDCLLSPLREDDGHLYFSYSSQIGRETAYYVCEDGNPTEIKATLGYSMTEASLVGGWLCYLQKKNNSNDWIYTEDNLSRYFKGSAALEDAHLVRIGKRCCFYGANANGEFFLWHPVRGMNVENFERESYYVLPDIQGSDLYATVVCSSSGQLLAKGPDYEFEEETAYFFSEHCACLYGNSLFVAVTPRGKESPYLWVNGRKIEYRIGNGFLSGVYVY